MDVKVSMKQETLTVWTVDIVDSDIQQQVTQKRAQELFFSHLPPSNVMSPVTAGKLIPSLFVWRAILDIQMSSEAEGQGRMYCELNTEPNFGFFALWILPSLNLPAAVICKNQFRKSVSRCKSWDYLQVPGEPSQSTVVVQYPCWDLGIVLINFQCLSPSENFGQKDSFLKDGLEQI